MVSFEAGGTRYGLDVAVVERVEDGWEIQTLPDPLPGVLGLIRVKHQLLPVLGDLAPDGTQVLCLGVEDQHFGVLVDRVLAVSRIDLEALEPPPAGQARPVVIGAIAGTLMLDPRALAARVGPPAPVGAASLTGPEAPTSSGPDAFTSTDLAADTSRWHRPA